jgi:DNA helicase-2/ATP-dependent DNA helicase PcrA
MTFNDYYNQLNPEQKQAVDSIEGPVMVVAGPGTGKTQILTLRIANILNKTDIEAENILALTFTDSGAMSMKKRLISIIGNDAYRVNINTFHSFCNDVIQNYPEYFSSIAGFTNIDEIKQTQILRNVLDNMKLTYLASFNNQYFYIKEIKHAIEELKKESVDFKELRTKAEQAKLDFLNNTDNYNSKTDKIKTAQLSILKTIEKNIELSFIYEDYQQELKQNLFYDYSDMIIEVLNALKTNEELLLILQEQYQYILVDEYQDTNTSQNKILELLCNFHQNPNIFIVGDPKQAIYRFQGASIQNFEFFKQLYPKAILIDLINNYRSSQLILDSAHSLIQKDVKLQSNAGFEDKKIQVFSLANPEKEAYFIITKIQELLKDGIPSNNIAVLYRNHRDADATIELLDKFGIPFSVKKKINIFNDVDIQKLLLILNTIYNYGNDEYLFKCLHIDFLNIDPLDVYKIINYCNQNHINGYEFLNSKHNLELTSIKQIESFNLKLKQ